MKAIVAHAAKDVRIEEFPDEDLGKGQVRLKLATGGICGSDLHYYNHGGFGTVRLRQPMVLGHEVSAVVEALGEGSRTWRSASWWPSRHPGLVEPAGIAAKAFTTSASTCAFTAAPCPSPTSRAPSVSISSPMPFSACLPMACRRGRRPWQNRSP